MLPFNVAHLGQSAYGLWVLAASITVYFSMLDMGYGVAQVRFAATYRAKNDSNALNEIVSTMFVVFSGIGLLTFIIAILLSLNLERLFPLTSDQATTGKIVLLFISGYVALGFPFSVFGGIVNGFQRTYLNGVVALITAIAVAITNVIVLSVGYGLVELVAATTTIRTLSYLAYALNAYRVFPALKIRLRSFSRSRLREITGFSIFILLIDLANKLNYSTDTIVIGAFIGTTGVAIWAVAQRLSEIVQRITDQINSALFPVVVDTVTVSQFDRLERILIQGTRLSLAMVIPMATTLAILAEPLVMAWVGPSFEGSIRIIQILCVVVAVRVGNSTSAVTLKGSGKHALLAASNISMALGNLVLSVILVRTYGLIGVALGTLIPIVVVSLLVVFPSACRQVRVSPLKIIRKSVWPAVWPASVLAGFLLITASALPKSPGVLILLGLFAFAIYVVLFLRFGINQEERQWYFAKVKEIINRNSVAAPSEMRARS